MAHDNSPRVAPVSRLSLSLDENDAGMASLRAAAQAIRNKKLSMAKLHLSRLRTETAFDLRLGSDLQSEVPNAD